MTKEECIALLIRYAEYDGMGIPNLDGCRDAMRMAAELLSQPQPSLPSNLDEAAEDSWAVYEYRESPSGLYYTCYVDGFKAGAELMAGQGETIECSVDWYDGPILDFSAEQLDSAIMKAELEVGDKVVVQIRKK